APARLPGPRQEEARTSRRSPTWVLRAARGGRDCSQDVIGLLEWVGNVSGNPAKRAMVIRKVRDETRGNHCQDDRKCSALNMILPAPLVKCEQGRIPPAQAKPLARSRGCTIYVYILIA